MVSSLSLVEKSLSSSNKSVNLALSCYYFREASMHVMHQFLLDIGCKMLIWLIETCWRIWFIFFPRRWCESIRPGSFYQKSTWLYRQVPRRWDSVILNHRVVLPAKTSAWLDTIAGGTLVVYGILNVRRCIAIQSPVVKAEEVTVHTNDTGRSGTNNSSTDN